MNLQKYIALAILTAMAFLSACTTVTPPTEDPTSPTGDITKDLAFEIFTKVGVSEALDGNKEDAQVVVNITEQMIETLETGVLTVPDLVDDRIIEYLKDSNLEPSSKQALYTLTTALSNQYARRIELGQLDPGSTAPVVTILKWVNQAARDTIRFGEVWSYGAEPLAVGSPIEWSPSGSSKDPSMSAYSAPEYSTNYNPPLWAKWKWGNHWSDPLWKVTSFFSGCETYAAFRGYHSYGKDVSLSEEEQAEFEAFEGRIEAFRPLIEHARAEGLL